MVREESTPTELEGLDDDQRACVLAADAAVAERSALVVLAGAGSGKSHTARRILERHRATALAISHTKFASVRLQAALSAHTGPKTSMTIHSLAFSLATRPPLDSPDAPLPPEQSDGGGGIDFDTMLERAIEALDCAPDPPRQLQHVSLLVVDEFQDTGSAQMRLIDMLRSRLHCAFIGIGDFAQSIFGFQDASPEHMNRLRACPGTREVQLRYNYRSHADIVAYVNALARVYGAIDGAVQMRATRAPRCERWMRPLQLRCFEGENQLMHASVGWIRNRKDMGRLCNGDVVTVHFQRDRWVLVDYAGRVVDVCDPPPEWSVASVDGRRITLSGLIERANERLSLDVHASPPLGGGWCHNPPRTLLVSCRALTTGAQYLRTIANILINDNVLEEHQFYLTEHDVHQPTYAQEQMQAHHICLLTVHGAKGGEWDSQMHIDTGESIVRPSDDDDEAQRILYTGHTRAIDELWHMCVCNYKRSLSRYMTEALVEGHFETATCYEWETTPTVEAVFFSGLIDGLEDEEADEEAISVSEVAKHTTTAWIPTSVGSPPPSVERIALAGAGAGQQQLPSLPNELKIRCNAIHGKLCEWLALWDLHRDATRKSLSDFLALVLHRFSVNRAFAIGAGIAWEGATDEERHGLADLFYEAVRGDDGAAVAIGTFHERVNAHMARVPRGVRLEVRRVSRDDLRTGFENARAQARRHPALLRRPDRGGAPCPVRPTIPHFDVHAGAAWNLDEDLRAKILDACRHVAFRGGNASIAHIFVCCAFMESVPIAGFAPPLFRGTRSDEQHWRILLLLLKSRRGLLEDYLSYVRSIRPLLRADALRVRQLTRVDAYQTPVEASIALRVGADGAPPRRLQYTVRGAADATSEAAVLEITSRATAFRTKVQQASLYAVMLGVDTLFTYYIEERLLVRRRLALGAREFKRRATEELLCNRGLPRRRRKLLMADVLKIEHSWHESAVDG